MRGIAGGDDSLADLTAGRHWKQFGLGIANGTTRLEKLVLAVDP